MSIKNEAQSIIENLDDSATWDDLVKELVRQKKITLGMREDELSKDLTDADVNAILGRIQSSSSQPDDMRNTRSYTPGNATTLGMVSGIIAILFAFVFPPISWVGAAIALAAGFFGLSKKEEKAWIPILMAVISIVPHIYIFLGK